MKETPDAMDSYEPSNLIHMLKIKTNKHQLNMVNKG